MTGINNRRKNKKPVNQRFPLGTYNNGYSYGSTDQRKRVGRTGFLDKSLHGWSRLSLLADVVVSASIGNDFSNGHRGMANAVRGAKKFVRTRIRFKENQATLKLAKEHLV